MTSADKDRHEMTQERIGLLLADAADSVEIGAAPVQAVIRAGRRRRARRRAVMAVTAVVLGTATGTLAMAGLPGSGGSGGSGGSVTPAKPGRVGGILVDQPQMTTLSFGTYEGVEWGVQLRVWPAPRDRAEAVKQMKAMDSWGTVPATTGSPSDLVGKTTYFFVRSYREPGKDDESRLMGAPQTVSKLPRPKGTDIRALPQPLTLHGPFRLAIGTVATTAKQVACHWRDGSTTFADRAPDNSPLHSKKAVIRSVRGFPTANWFVCQAPGPTTFKSAEVTK
ncbi:MAG: hypothetical protein LBV60_22090 [Streptomyces sp.]|jgi:hypothetical protein|nr:hypothetical protein [Streptomyces sp.]